MQEGDLVFISGKYFNEKSIQLNFFISVVYFYFSCLLLFSMKILHGKTLRLSPIFFLAKSFPHNMVHVEIWLGEGEKTIGARWKSGKCV